MPEIKSNGKLAEHIVCQVCLTNQKLVAFNTTADYTEHIKSADHWEKYAGARDEDQELVGETDTRTFLQMLDDQIGLIEAKFTDSLKIRARELGIVGESREVIQISEDHGTKSAASQISESYLGV